MRNILTFSLAFLGGLSIFYILSKPTFISHTIPVQGMTCEACSQTIHTSLSKLDGVKEASVSFENKSVSITYNQKTLTLDDIKNNIIKEGYSISE